MPESPPDRGPDESRVPGAYEAAKKFRELASQANESVGLADLSGFKSLSDADLVFSSGDPRWPSFHSKRAKVNSYGLPLEAEEGDVQAMALMSAMKMPPRGKHAKQEYDPTEDIEKA